MITGQIKIRVFCEYDEDEDEWSCSVEAFDDCLSNCHSMEDYDDVCDVCNANWAAQESTQGLDVDFFLEQEIIDKKQNVELVGNLCFYEYRSFEGTEYDIKFEEL